MAKATQGAAIAASLIFVAASTMGCSGMGYVIGGAIDGGTNYERDSVSVRLKVDNAGEEHRSWDMEHLASLVKEALPGKGSIVEVQAGKESFNGDAFDLDTVFAVKGEPADSVSEWLLPGEFVTLTTKVTQAKGTVVHLSERNILLRVDGEDRGYALSWVKTILLSNGRILSDSGLASPDFSRRLVRVPGILLGQGSLQLFIPLRQMDRVRVGRRIVWGNARTIGFLAGVMADVLFLYSSSRDNLVDIAVPVVATSELTFWGIWALTK